MLTGKRGFGVALRVIPNHIKTMEELNLPSTLRKFIERKQGLVLMVGPTGHGKSTALAAMINEINNTRAEHILTIEDPIEFVFTPNKSIISQRELYLDTPTLPALCGRLCAKILTWFWWAKCAIWNPFPRP